MESKINEMVRINSYIGGMNELEFGYLPLGEIMEAGHKSY